MDPVSPMYFANMKHNLFNPLLVFRLCYLVFSKLMAMTLTLAVSDFVHGLEKKKCL